MTKEEFQEWANHPVTRAVRDTIESEIKVARDYLMEKETKTVEDAGVYLISSQSYINGLKRFWDFDDLLEQVQSNVGDK